MTRRMLLMRHARARLAAAGGDAARELAPEGRRQCVGVAGRLREFAPDLVLSSPAIRCVQTAEEVLAAMGLPDRRVITQELLGSDDGQACMPLVEAATGTILVVSHHPTLLGLGAALLGGGLVDLRPGQVAILEGSPGAWTLVSVVDPESRG